jgi:formamidopyrimidine-DNA glycosylase
MPELPNVERLKRMLAGKALGKRIDQVIVADARILDEHSARAFVERLQSASLVEVRRHGKHLMAKLDRRGRLTLHLGMMGAPSFR